MKRICMIIMSFLLLFVFLQTPVFAAEIASGSCGDGLTWVISEEGVLTISGTGAMDDTSGWKAYEDQVTAIVVEEGVTSIANSAFLGMHNLVSAELPDTVLSIGDHAFWFCDRLKEMKLPKNATVGAYCFDACSSLESLIIPDLYLLRGLEMEECPLLKTMGPIGGDYNIQFGCSSYEFGQDLARVYRWAEELTLPDNITKLDEGAFKLLTSIRKVVLPSKIEAIPVNAFENLTNLEEVVLPDGLKRIEMSAFEGCTSLATVNIPASVTHISGRAFYECKSLTSAEIPEGIEELETYTFIGCQNLQKITLPSTLKIIGEEALAGCYSLMELDLPEGLEKIEVRGLSGYAGTELKIPDSVTSIGNYAFQNCHGLEHITIPASVDRIPIGMLTYCNNLKTVTVLGDLKIVRDDAFSYCPNLQTVTFMGYVQEMERNAFMESSGKGYYLPDDPLLNEIATFHHPFYLYPCAKGHSYGDWQIVTEPTQDTKGQAQRVCECGEAEIKILPVEGTNPFVDVAYWNFYFEPVLWALENNVTTGKDATHFAPSNPCTRSQVVTFLWRAAGQPEPASSENPFPDVPEGKFYTKAVLWAVEQGITAGFKDGTFGPNDACTRGQIVTFLWRYFGEPEPASSENPFPDVVESKFYYKAVLWAVENEITGGFKDGTFGPNKTCTRDQIVTFLYRCLVK